MYSGWIDQNEVTIIPGCSQATFSIAVGMSGASHTEWEDYFGMFARSVRHLNIVFITGYQGNDSCAVNTTSEY